MSICTFNMDGQCCVFSHCLPGDRDHLLLRKLRVISEDLRGGVCRAGAARASQGSSGSSRTCGCSIWARADLGEVLKAAMP